MPKNKKKGFTLVELLAVVILLIIVMGIAIMRVNHSMEKARINAFIDDASEFAKGAQNKYSADRTDDRVGEDLFHNAIKGKVCYSIEQQLLGNYVDKPNSKYTGSVEICYGLDCTYSYKIWMTDGEHYIDGETGINDTSIIKEKYTTDYPLTCGVEALGGGGTGGDLLTAEFKFEPHEYVMTIVKDGVYALEAWGAQGGRAGIYRGGYGGYSYTEVELHVGDKLYINVGGEGNIGSSSVTNKGGYNMGGSSDGSGFNGSGGGATTITTRSGFISKPILEDYIYIVAGGGGGGHNGNPWCCSEGVRAGYSGGGIADEANQVGQSCCNYGAGSSSGGHGGGYRAGNWDHGSVGRGGSGFIANPLTRNGVMYGYRVPSSTSTNTKTISTTNISSDPRPGYAKMGDGFAKITYIGTFTEPEVGSTP